MTSDGQQAETAHGLGPKQRIFRAALSVALRKGFGKVTLGLVAREAGLSKGGQLYHFGSKNNLIRAMLEHYARWSTRPASVLRASGLSDDLPSDVDPLAVATLVAAAEGSELLEPVREMLRASGIAANRVSHPMLTPLSLAGHLANWLGLATQERHPAAYVVRHKANISVLGLFVAQDIDALWDMVDEFCDPTEYEYRPAVTGALALSKNEMGFGAFGSAYPLEPVEYGLEMNWSLTEAAMADDAWTAFDAADEGSGVVARTLGQLERTEQAPSRSDPWLKETGE